MVLCDTAIQSNGFLGEGLRRSIVAKGMMNLREKVIRKCISRGLTNADHYSGSRLLPVTGLNELFGFDLLGKGVDRDEGGNEAGNGAHRCGNSGLWIWQRHGSLFFSLTEGPFQLDDRMVNSRHRFIAWWREAAATGTKCVKEAVLTAINPGGCSPQER